MKFKDVLAAVINKREKELDRGEMMQAVHAQIRNLDQQRKNLWQCVFGRKRWNSGKNSKFVAEHSTTVKPGPWFEHIESERVLKKHDAVAALSEQVLVVKKRLGIE